MATRAALPAEVDGIVIGGGHNGLVAANYLARAGAQVLVLESQPRLGGGLSTEEGVTLPLFRHNLHVFFVRWTPNYRIWNDLELSRYGLRTVTPEVQNALPFREGGGLTHYHDLDRTLEAIRERDPRDAETYARVYREYEAMVRHIVDPLRFSPPLPADELESLLKGSDLGRRYLEIARRSALEVVLDLFRDEAVRALVLFNVAVRAYLPVLDVPGTGYIVVLALFGSHHGAMVLGGTQEAARALAAGVYEHGGLLATGAKVARVLVENGRAAGVELEDGRRVRARKFVASNLPAALTLGELVDPEHLDGDLRQAVTNYRWNEEALFGVHLALREPPRYRGVEPEAPFHRALNYCVGYERTEDFLRDMGWIREGKVPTEPALHVGVPTLFDPTQAPPGFATAFAWQFVPSRPEGGPERWTEAENERFAELIMAKWREYAPNLAEAELARATHSPLDTFHYDPAMVLGDRHHGSYHPENFDANRPHPALSGYRTPIEGLYLCGSGTYPGGSFTGQPGYNAATVIARDLGLDLWWRPPDPRHALEDL